MGDRIDQLPTDENPVSPNDFDIVSALFKKKNSSRSLESQGDRKERLDYQTLPPDTTHPTCKLPKKRGKNRLLIVVTLAMLLASSLSDPLLSRYLKIENQYLLLGAKILFVLVLLYLFSGFIL